MPLKKYCAIGDLKESVALVHSLLKPCIGRENRKMESAKSYTYLQSEERQVGLRTSSWTLDIFVISQPNWLKFGLQAHFLKMFGHAKFQPSSICSFRFLLVNFSRHF